MLHALWCGRMLVCISKSNDGLIKCHFQCALEKVSVRRNSCNLHYHQLRPYRFCITLSLVMDPIPILFATLHPHPTNISWQFDRILKEVNTFVQHHWNAAKLPSEAVAKRVKGQSRIPLLPLQASQEDSTVNCTLTHCTAEMFRSSIWVLLPLVAYRLVVGTQLNIMDGARLHRIFYLILYTLVVFSGMELMFPHMAVLEMMYPYRDVPLF